MSSVPQPRPFFTPGKHSEPRDTGSAELAPIPLMRRPTGVAHLLEGPFRAREPAPSPRSPRQPHSSAPLLPRLPGTAGNFPSAGATDTRVPGLLPLPSSAPNTRLSAPHSGATGPGAAPSERILRPGSSGRPPPARGAAPARGPRRLSHAPGPPPAASRPARLQSRRSRPAAAECKPRRLRIPRRLALWPGQLFSSLQGGRGPAPPPGPPTRPRPPLGPAPGRRLVKDAGEKVHASGSRRAEEEVRRGGSRVAPVGSPCLPAASCLQGLWLESRRVLRRYPRLKMEPSPSPRPPLRTSTSGRTLILCLETGGIWN